jgi:hypothetical protein
MPQLRPPKALCSRLSPAVTGLLTRAPTPRRNQQKEHIHTATPKIGCANYTMVEKIPAGEEVLDGTYYLREHPIVILFDSGASNDFLSVACAQKTNLSPKKTEVQYLILTPGGRVVADRMVHKIPLELIGRIFSTNLLILEG